MARISPDGRKVALVVGPPPIQANSNSDIWVYDLQTENARQLTFSPRLDDGPVWTSDSKQIYFRSFEGGDGNHSGVYSVPAEGGTPTTVARSDDFQYALPWSISPDDRALALVSATTQTDIDLAILDLRGHESAFRVLLKGNPGSNEPAIAPNGQWIAYEELKGGPGEINIRPYPEVTRQRYPVGSGAHPTFSRDGSELFFFDGQGLAAASVAYQPSLRIGTTQQLFRGQYWYGVVGPGGGLGRAWDVDRKSERFLMIQMPGAATTAGGKPTPPIRLNVVLNWNEELKRRVSTH